MRWTTEEMLVAAGVVAVGGFAAYELFYKPVAASVNNPGTAVPAPVSPMPPGSAWVSVTAVAQGNRVRMTIPATSTLYQSESASGLTAVAAALSGATVTQYPAGSAVPADWPSSDSGGNALRLDFVAPSALDFSAWASQGIQVWVLKSVSGRDRSMSHARSSASGRS